MKKRVLSLILAMCLLFCITGCSETYELQNTSSEIPVIITSTPTITSQTITWVTSEPATTSDDVSSVPVSSEKTLTSAKSASSKPATVTSKPATVTSKPAETTNSKVWISKSGKKYHAYAGCSNMKNPTQVTKSEAEQKGLTPCSKCY